LGVISFNRKSLAIFPIFRYGGKVRNIFLREGENGPDDSDTKFINSIHVCMDDSTWLFTSHTLQPNKDDDDQEEPILGELRLREFPSTCNDAIIGF
jgi:hypothetical protein